MSLGTTFLDAQVRDVYFPVHFFAYPEELHDHFELHNWRNHNEAKQSVTIFLKDDSVLRIDFVVDYDERMSWNTSVYGDAKDLLAAANSGLLGLLAKMGNLSPKSLQDILENEGWLRYGLHNPHEGFLYKHNDKFMTSVANLSLTFATEAEAQSLADKITAKDLDYDRPLEGKFVPVKIPVNPRLSRGE